MDNQEEILREPEREDEGEDESDFAEDEEHYTRRELVGQQRRIVDRASREESSAAEEEMDEGEEAEGESKDEEGLTEAEYAEMEDDVGREGEEERSGPAISKDTIRMSIFELDSYVSSSRASGAEDAGRELPEPKKIRMSESMGLPGLVRIDLSLLTQKIMGCVIGENVTTEYPWIYVKKEIIEDNIDLHEESSDFLPIKEEIRLFPDAKILIGYSPTSGEDGQFYVCITEAGRDAVVRYIEHLRDEQESRVRNAVYKMNMSAWIDLGSGVEVDDSIVKKSRPLFEIEVFLIFIALISAFNVYRRCLCHLVQVESTANLLNAPMNFKNRDTAEQRDGYLALLPYRQTFDNVVRSLVSRGEQTRAPTTDDGTQTEPSMPATSWCQYQYDSVWEGYDDTQLESMNKFLESNVEKVCDQVLVNATWDIYINDFANLAQSERDTLPPVAIKYTEHQSYSDGRYTTDKVINDLCWHPLWTGIAAATYTDHAKSEHIVGQVTDDQVTRACHESNLVLIWSFSDCLSPKLVLESPREVTAVSICPLDGNVIIGGCANGQIGIWNIPGKIEQVEAVVVHTTAQVKYRIAMRSLMKWMKESTGSTIIRPAAMSSLRYSQKAAITEIVWIPLYNKVDKNGRIQSLPEDTPKDELTWQFITSSEDGTIAFWDLKWRPADGEEHEPGANQDRPRGKKGMATTKRKGVRRPSGLTQTISPYKVLDRIFKPDYLLVIQYPDELHRAVVTTMDLHNPPIRKVCVGPVSVGQNDITVRKYYKSIIEKPDHEMFPEIFVGTAEGDCARVTWEGFDFTTGVAINREQCTWKNWCKIHDGPVTHSVKSKYLADVILTVGGRVFALWREDADDPVLWRKSHLRYTACSWGTFRPTVLILARSDGTIEIWDLIVTSQEPSFTQSVSGSIITGIYTHELYLSPQCVGFCDYNGTLRVFYAPRLMLIYTDADVNWMRSFVDREVERTREFKEWQSQWNETNIENIEMKKKLAEEGDERKRIEAQEKLRAEMMETAARAAARASASRGPRSGQFLEEAKERWKSMELRRMQRVILEKKGLKEDELERRRAPVMKMRQDARMKKKKIRQAVQLQDKIFEDTVTFLFPEQYQERKSLVLPSLPTPGIQGESKVQDDLKELIDQENKQLNNIEEEYIYEFLECQTKGLAAIRKHPYKHSFDWRKILHEGKGRRSEIDNALRRREGHRQSYYRKKEIMVNSASVDELPFGRDPAEEEADDQGGRTNEENVLMGNIPAEEEEEEANENRNVVP